MDLQPSCRCGVEGPPSASSLHGRKMDARVLGGQPIGEVSVKTFLSLLREALQKEKAMKECPRGHIPPKYFLRIFLPAPPWLGTLLYLNNFCFERLPLCKYSSLIKIVSKNIAKSIFSGFKVPMACQIIR